jgi:hypothetical protein
MGSRICSNIPKEDGDHGDGDGGDGDEGQGGGSDGGTALFYLVCQSRGENNHATKLSSQKTDKAKEKKTK